MKPGSNQKTAISCQPPALLKGLKSLRLAVVLLALGSIPAMALAADNSNLFNSVPAGDPTYNQLLQLEKAGLLPAGASQKSLTRFEVAENIWKAEKKYKEIVVADADMELPPSPPGESSASAPGETPLPPSEGETGSSTGSTVTNAPHQAPKALVTPDYTQHPEKLAQAETALRTLQQAYELELSVVQQQKESLTDQVTQAEEDQYALWRSLKSVNESPSISLHGTGRMSGISRQYFGSGSAVTLSYPNLSYNPFGNGAPSGLIFPSPSATRLMNGYLDLEPTGALSKQIHWNGIIRLGTSALPLSGDFYQNGLGYDYLTFRRISMEFSPDFMTATLGDFEESYTPLTLWNRNNLDLAYKPEPMERLDAQQKYESFFDHTPAWPFRGVRIGTALGWPDSPILDRISVSGFAHMIRAGFNDYTSGGWIFNSNGNQLINFFPDFIFAGQAEIRSKKLYTGDVSLQASLKGYGVILDEFLDPYQTGPNTAISPPPFPPSGLSGNGPVAYTYYPYIPNTWAHQYRIGSLKPEVKVGMGGDAYLGLVYEGAFSAYQDDKTNQTRTISDYAIMASPYLQLGDSKVTLNYLNVGPYYYSPLAQTRQDVLLPTASAATVFGLPTMGLYSAPLKSLFFLTNVPRPGGNNGFYGFYDRTQDNVFPYGLGTPNRQGVGVDLDIKALKGNALKVAGSAYFLQEITGNLVVNQAGTTFAGLDTAPSGKVPVRKFTYVNIGPSFDIGPSAGLKTPLEIGTNVRYEDTSSNLGDLTDLWILGGVKAGLFTWWEVSAAYGIQNMSGTDAGYVATDSNGKPFQTTLARYPYLFDNVDLINNATGKPYYAPFTVNGTVQNLLLSTTFNIDRNSKLHFDYSLAYGNEIPNLGTYLGTLNNEFMELNYEVKF